MIKMLIYLFTAIFIFMAFTLVFSGVINLLMGFIINFQ